MSNIITDIQVSGVTYTLSAETSGGGITSGEVQTMIDQSISGKVNVSDNEVSGLTIKNDIVAANSYKYSYGDITDFWIEMNSDTTGSTTLYPYYITSGGSTGWWAVTYSYSGRESGITVVTNTSGNFTYELVDGKLHIMFNEGYSLYYLYNPSSWFHYYYNTTYQGGQSADVIEGSVNDALNDLNGKIITNALTSITTTYNDRRIYVGGSSNGVTTSSSSVFLNDNKTLKYVTNEGLHVSFSASTPTLEYLNYGSDVHWLCPSYPSYDNSYDSLIISFNSGYTGSTTSYDLIVYTINSGGTRQSDTYTYDPSNYTLTFKSGSNITDFVMDGYNAVFTIKEGNSGLKMNCVAQYSGQIIGVDAVDKSPYSITGVSTPTYDYNGQVIIDDIYTKLGGKQDTLSAGTGIEISGNVISATGGSIEVSSAITSGDTNPVQGGVLYDELRIPSEVESGLTLEWYNYDGGETENYPIGSGCSKITFEVVISGGTEGDEWEQNEGWFYVSNVQGNIHIAINNGVVTASAEDGFPATCSVNGNIVTVEYPTIADDVIRWYSSYDNHWATTAYVNTTTIIPIIDQVSANTVSLSGKQDTLSAGTGISISGNVISASGGGGNPTVELTQAEYDALVSAGTVSADTFYIITDASPQDMSNYWTSAQTQSAINQATSGKVDTSSVVTAVTSGSTDSEIPTAKAVYDAIPTGGTGGGKAISAGTNISVTTGETADTINCTLPISASSEGIYTTSSYPFSSTARKTGNVVFGYNNILDTFGSSNHSNYNTFFGSNHYIDIKGDNMFIAGDNNRTSYPSNTSISNIVLFGFNNKSSNPYETAFGRYNVSQYSSDSFGNSGNTLFSVGNGTSANARHNAFEIRQNGDMYLNNGTSDIKLQDYLQIKVVKLTQSAYDALSPNYDSNTLYIIKD